MHSIRIFAKNMGDPYYEPTIVVHDRHEETTSKQSLPVWKFIADFTSHILAG